MPISYRLDAAQGVIRITFSGRVTVDEFRQSRGGIGNDPGFRPEMHRLTDVRDLTELPGLDELRELARVAAIAQQHEPRTVRRGVIVASQVTYGVVRQYQTFLSLAGYEVDILVGDAEAERWLAGLPAVRTVGGTRDDAPPPRP
jgi:hypothetical protein